MRIKISCKVLEYETDDIEKLKEKITKLNEQEFEIFKEYIKESIEELDNICKCYEDYYWLIKKIHLTSPEIIKEQIKLFKEGYYYNVVESIEREQCEIFLSRIVFYIAQLKYNIKNQII